MTAGNVRAIGWTFAQVPVWLLCDNRVSDGAKVLFGYLKYRQGNDAACWPSRETISSDLGIAARSVSRRLQELECFGYVVRNTRSGKTTLYELVADPDEQEVLWNAKQQQRKQHQILTSASRYPCHPRQDNLDTNVNQDDKKGTIEKDESFAPAVEVYYKWFPDTKLNEVQVDNMAALVPDSRLPVWDGILQDWKLAGYNPSNVGGMLDAFANGGIRGKRETVSSGGLISVPWVD